MALTLAAFGAPDLRKDGAPVAPELAWRKHFALLVYLARSPGGARRRAHLLGLLWPDKDDARARHSLNEACRAIRRGAGDAALRSDADTITLDPACLTADWNDLDQALAAGDLVRAAALWRGEFLEGFGIPDATAFEDWLAGERAAWRARLRDAFTAGAERAAGAGDAPAALALAVQALTADPAAERALAVAMRAEALAGAAPAALERYAAYDAWLEREHGARPAPELAALADRIREGLRPDTGPPAPRRDPPPLVGRTHALAAVAPFLPRPGASAAVALVTGAAGCGRSRLVREIAARARLGGARIAVTSCIESDDVPGAMLGALARGGLLEAPGLAAAPPHALALLAGFAPEVASRYPGVQPCATTLPADAGRALGEALAAAAEEAPLLVAIDDLHLADGLSLAALPAALRSCATAPVLLVVSAPAAGSPDAVTALRRRIGTDIPGLELAADALDAAAIAELSAAMLPAYGAAERERLVRRLGAETNGVTLYVVEILRALALGGAAAGLWPLAGATTAQPLPFKVPGAVLAALTLRVNALTPAARRALLVAAALGERVDEALLARVAGPQAGAPAESLVELEASGFLEHDGERYRFPAAVVRTVLAADMLAGGDRRAIHERAAAALREQPPTDAGAALTLADHLYGAGDWRGAAAAARAAAELAACEGADRLADRALRLEAKAAERSNRG